MESEHIIPNTTQASDDEAYNNECVTYYEGTTVTDNLLVLGWFVTYLRPSKHP